MEAVGLACSAATRQWATAYGDYCERLFLRGEHASCGSHLRLFFDALHTYAALCTLNFTRVALACKLSVARMGVCNLPYIPCDSKTCLFAHFAREPSLFHSRLGNVNGMARRARAPIARKLASASGI